MKFLVSTLNLSRKIREAIALNANRICVDYDAKTMTLYAYGKEMENKITSITININPIGQRWNGGVYDGNFDLKKWEKLLVFLLLLEEQPIVFEFTDYDTKFHDEPQIKLSQFEKRF